jgi:hypothetical protein
MQNIVAVAVSSKTVQPFELKIVTDHKPDFLPPVTLVKSENSSALLYSKEDLVPLAEFVRTSNVSLSIVFTLITGYIHSLSEAHDKMLNTCLVSSDPEKGVFVFSPETYMSGSIVTRVKTIWGADSVSDEREKICRVAELFARLDRVMGARTAMERMIDIIRSGNLSLKNCLVAAERVCREWNRIGDPI